MIHVALNPKKRRNNPGSFATLAATRPLLTNHWSTEESDDQLYADRRNFYTVEKWSRDDQATNEVVAGMATDITGEVFGRPTV